MNKTMLAILDVLDKHYPVVIGSREISRELRLHGVDLTERTVRYHLKILDERGFTQVFGKEGRKITEKGKEERLNAMVSEKVGFIISKIESLSCMTNFDADTGRGEVILNVSYFPEDSLGEAVKVMQPVFSSPFVMSDMVAVARGGEKLGGFAVPAGKTAIGTICSVTINGIFLGEGIPVTSKFGGILQVENGAITRFVALISYDGTSLDPHLVFIKSAMLNVTDAVKRGSGKILASFREIPVVSVEKAKATAEKLRALSIGGIVEIGNPNQPLLEMPVGMDKAGMLLVGGLNPVAALEEAGISTESKAMAIFYNYADLLPFKEAVKALRKK